MPQGPSSVSLAQIVDPKIHIFEQPTIVPKILKPVTQKIQLRIQNFHSYCTNNIICGMKPIIGSEHVNGLEMLSKFLEMVGEVLNLGRATSSEVRCLVLQSAAQDLLTVFGGHVPFATSLTVSIPRLLFRRNSRLLFRRNCWR